jgi:hypothetical protein
MRKKRFAFVDSGAYAPCGFQENYSRWPENLAQKIIVYNVPLLL